MTTNNHPAHGPVSLERLHQIREILSKAAAQSDGGNLGYAMADAVKVIDGAIAAFGAEPVAWTEKCEITNMQATGLYLRGFPDNSQSRDIALYTAPPAPVVHEGLRMALSNAGIAAPESDEMLAATHEKYIQALITWVKDRKPFQPAQLVPEEVSWEDVPEEITEDNMEVALAWAHGFNHCRAAMLKAGNHTEQHLDMVVHSGDDNEKADCRLPFDQWLSQQNEPIDVDCGCVTTEAFYHWLRVAYEAGNSPVTPDGWKLVPVELTGAMTNAMTDAILDDLHNVDVWRSVLAAAPQQEVK